MRSPVLLLVFNRPESTRSAFEAIRRARPPRLYVAADGPRDADEAALCAEVRAIATVIDWPCEVQTLFRHTNLGCKRAVSQGITWFFDHEPEGIILEDDVVPDPTFFPYCDELLDRYRSSPEVMVISANHFHGDSYRPATSYVFSRYVHVWGWASWRRAWEHYDAAMAQWPTARASGVLLRLADGDRDFADYWTALFDATYVGKIDTWDYQWVFATMLREGLVAAPSVNLARNIGFSADATHTGDPTVAGANLALEQMSFPLRHPTSVARDSVADDWEEQHLFSIHARRRHPLQDWIGAIRSRFSVAAFSSRRR